MRFFLRSDHPQDLPVFFISNIEIPQMNQVSTNHKIKSAGSYEINFDESILSSEIYFYNPQAGGFTEIKRMILLK
jgi:hypothetical protein